MSLVTFQAGEPVDKFTPVIVSSGGLALKASALGETSALVAGLTISSGTTYSQIRVQTDNIVAEMSGLVPGQPYYLGLSSGTIASGYSSWATSVASTFVSGVYFVPLGVALSSTSLMLEIENPIFVSNSGAI